MNDLQHLGLWKGLFCVLRRPCLRDGAYSRPLRCFYCRLSLTRSFPDKCNRDPLIAVLSSGNKCFAGLMVFLSLEAQEACGGRAAFKLAWIHPPFPKTCFKNILLQQPPPYLLLFCSLWLCNRAVTLGYVVLAALKISNN